MRAAGTPLKAHAALCVKWFAGIVIVVVAGASISLVPDQALLKPGRIVSYAEDRVGRPWTIVRRVGYQKFEARNGDVLIIAEAGEFSPYRGYTSNVTVDMAGQHWRHKVAEIQRDLAIRQAGEARPRD